MNLQAYQNEFEGIHIVDEDRPGGYIVAEQVDDDLSDLFLAAPDMEWDLKVIRSKAAEAINGPHNPDEYEKVVREIFRIAESNLKRRNR